MIGQRCSLCGERSVHVTESGMGTRGFCAEHLPAGLPSAVAFGDHVEGTYRAYREGLDRVATSLRYASDQQ